MKIILTEEQLKVIKLLKENTVYADRMKENIKDLKDDCNKLYSVMTFTTLAELRDNDSDAGIMKQKFEIIENKKDSLDKQLFTFEQRNMNYDGDWYDPKLEEDYNEMDIALHNLGPKIDSLGQIVDYLEAASEPDIHIPFKDVKPIDL